MADAAQTPQVRKASMGLNLPRRKLRYRFSMTPLADVLFQLLIFFMLSSNIVPYSMLTLRSGVLQGGGGGETTADSETPSNSTNISATAIWTLYSDAVVSGGQRFNFNRLSALAGALDTQGTENVLIIVRPEVAVQQITTILEMLASYGVSSVQIADGGPK